MIGGVLIGWLAAALVALMPVLCGRWARGLDRDWWSFHLAVLLLVTAAFALLVALVAASGEAGARHAGAAQGVVAFVVCAVPVVAFYSLGYRVRRDRLLGSLWLAASIPFTGYAALAALALINDVLCRAGCGLT